jgi:hypothetical protein
MTLVQIGENDAVIAGKVGNIRAVEKDDLFALVNWQAM